ncbi:MAG TPA: hypothetical protein DHW15_02240 [Bacteroidetes bacterium]|jgi:hypothetical protein|nr:MAG: hypothetical protein ABR94_06345 [Sphingobacteriales bacterium BACL12 MAG-120802-bin5]HCK21006.1 hypothetical protein [Bacteroidota bacterium]
MEQGKMIMVIGSLNANPADREISRDNIRSVQLFGADKKAIEVPFFNSWGELGMSSMAVHPDDAMQLYFATSSEVFLFDLNKGTHENLQIPNLTDIHEISIIGEELWISNTKHDEIVSYNIRKKAVERRVDLSDFASSSAEDIENGEGVEVVDKFHCNLVFQGYDQHVYILVHHTSGRQLIKRIAQKFIKSQGNGGVVNIDTQRRYPLNFKAPHSVRCINDEYWVFDSGHFELKVFNKDWQWKKTIDTKGFGRGGEYSAATNRYYAGVSATRKRYLGLFPGGDAIPNMVQVVDAGAYKVIDTVAVPNVEQINNVYCLDTAVATKLLEL